MIRKQHTCCDDEDDLSPFVARQNRNLVVQNFHDAVRIVVGIHHIVIVSCIDRHIRCKLATCRDRLNDDCHSLLRTNGKLVITLAAKNEYRKRDAVIVANYNIHDFRLDNRRFVLLIRRLQSGQRELSNLPTIHGEPPQSTQTSRGRYAGGFIAGKLCTWEHHAAISRSHLLSIASPRISNSRIGSSDPPDSSLRITISKGRLDGSLEAPEPPIERVG